MAGIFKIFLALALVLTSGLAEELEIDWSLNELDQDDPKLIQIIKEKYLIPPSDKPYNFSQTPDNKLDLSGQHDQPISVSNILDKKRNGFFVEAGAYDGQSFSNTLLFELDYDWTGLLVEPNPDAFESLKTKNRKAYLINACLSTKTTPEVIEFDACGMCGGITNNGRNPCDKAHEDLKFRKEEDPSFKPRHPYNRRTIKMQCLPLYSILKALGKEKEVDYFSLDIEGAEFPVLKTLPYDKVDIKVMTVEMNHIGDIFEGRGTQLKFFMRRNGYQDKTFREGYDDIFIQKKLVKKDEL